MGVGEGDYTPVARKFRACSVQDFVDVLCFEYDGAEAGYDWMATAEDAVSVTEAEAEKIGVDDGPEERRVGELDGLYFGIARDF